MYLGWPGTQNPPASTSYVFGIPGMGDECGAGDEARASLTPHALPWSLTTLVTGCELCDGSFHHSFLFFLLLLFHRPLFVCVVAAAPVCEWVL